MDVERVELGPGRMLGVHERVPMAQISSVFDRAMPAAFAALGRRGLAPAGPPMALYSGPVGDTVDVTIGVPIDASAPPVADGADPDGVVERALPVGPAVVVEHVGPYDTLVDTYAELERWMAAEGLRPGPDMWEEYLTDPGEEPDPGRWRTRIVYPVA